jgi:ATP-binding cassette, subfamily B, bacterial MsbA
MKFETLKIILLRIFNSYIRRDFSKIILALILSFGVAGGTAAIAWLLDPAVKKIFIEQDNKMVFLIPIAIVLAFTTKGLSLYFARTILIKLANKVVRSIQLELSECILKSDIHTIESKHSGKYISHYNYDISLVSNLVGNGTLNLMKDLLTLTALISLMFYQNWKLACFALIMMPLAAFVAKSLGRRLGKVTSQSAAVMGNLVSFLSDMIKGSRMTKIYQQEMFELKRSEKIMTEYMEKQNKIGYVMVSATPVMEIMTGVIIAGFIYYTGLMVATGEIEINNFFSFLTAMMLAYQPIRSLATINMLFYQGAAGAERVFKVLDTEANIKENNSSNDIKINKGKVEFKDVGFAYPNTNDKAVKNINIEIEGGSTAALVGHSGAGKSTIINLIPRFYDPKNGKVFIDGQNISEVKLSSLRKNISLVSQDTILFDDTIKANIAYANLNASDEDIKKACQFAAATEFIEKLPQSYNTLIGENGIRLSGGQKQRISIARAILKDSPIILLDEATSSLDSDSEEKVQNAVINLTKNKTTLVIAHRLSTIIRADKIFVVNQGEIIETGTHTELLKNSKVYKNLYSKQLSSN